MWVCSCGERTFDMRKYSSIVTLSPAPFTFSSSGVGAVGVWWEWNALPWASLTWLILTPWLFKCLRVELRLSKRNWHPQKQHKSKTVYKAALPNSQCCSTSWRASGTTLGGPCLTRFCVSWSSRRQRALCGGLPLSLVARWLGFLIKARKLRKQPLEEKAFCLSAAAGTSSSRICGPLGVCHSPKQKLRCSVRYCSAAPGNLGTGATGKAAVDLETSTQWQGKVRATAFSDSFASWMMF